MSEELTVSDYTQEQAAKVVALYKTTGAAQRWLLLAMYERKAHEAYNIPDFADFVEKVLETDIARSTVYMQIQWAKMEKDLEGIPHSMAPLFEGGNGLKQIPAEMTDTERSEDGKFVKRPSKLLTSVWFNELKRLPNLEAQRQIYYETKGAMEIGARTPKEYNADIKRRVDGYLKASSAITPAKEEKPLETASSAKEAVIVQDANGEVIVTQDNLKQLDAESEAPIFTGTSGTIEEEEESPFEEEEEPNMQDDLTQLVISTKAQKLLDRACAEMRTREGVPIGYSKTLEFILDGWLRHSRG